MENFETPLVPIANRRQTLRRRSLLGATVALNNRSSTIDCVLRNLSDEGAQIRFSGLFRPPHHFDLLIPKLRRDHACEVVWRDEADVGVKFLA